MQETDDAPRPDLEIIAGWIDPGSRVLDLGCGDGTLLAHLARTRAVTGYGLEIDDAYIPVCIARGVNVIQFDLNRGLTDFGTAMFDFVVLSLALPGVENPTRLLEEMVRVGRQGIVSFPNLGYWRVRLRLAMQGRRPETAGVRDTCQKAHSRYQYTMKDFEILCRERNIRVLERRAADRAHQTGPGLRAFPNLLGEIALYRIARIAS